ncbi:MAG: DUF4170 domain-containing protein, partial [Alphaproteobacteria bacterium]|nr:DUF4170 domain-containing protein [Alphaproteobacteria bacterium]
FEETEARNLWRSLTGKTVDNAMVRYFLKSADEVNGKIYWVVGGEYSDSTFSQLAPGAALDVYGPFEKWEALGFWRGVTGKTVDNAMVRYDIRKNYDPKVHGAGAAPLPAAKNAAGGAVTKWMEIASAPVTVFDFLADGSNWPKFAMRNLPSVNQDGGGWAVVSSPAGWQRLEIKADRARGVLDYTLIGRSGRPWSIPARVVPAGGGAVVMMTFSRPESMSEAEFQAGLKNVDDEFAALKKILQ